MQTKFSITVILMLLVFAGCTYSPTGEHFEELDPSGNAPYVEVELNFDTDTLYVCNNEWISFHYTKKGDKVNWSRFIIDGQETSHNDEKQGGLELYWYFPGFPPGTHTLSMQLYTQSGTGSIADKTGAEGFLLQKDWVLIVTDDWGMGSAIIDTSFENGLLNLKWEKFKGLNFEYYEVYKYVQPTGLPDQLVATIYDQHQTTVSDPDYHGENSMYFVRVNDRYRGKSIDMDGPLPQLSATNNAQGDIVLHWEKPPFWAALKGYRIMDDEVSWSDTGFSPLYLIDNPLTDSFVVPDPYFGYEYDFWLQLDPKGTAYLENWTRPVFLATRASASYGSNSPKFGWSQIGTENKIYLSYSGLYIFDTETLETSTPKDIPTLFRTHVSLHNNYLIGTQSGSYEMFLYDLNNTSNSKSINLSDKLSNLGHLASVSDIGTGVVISNQKAVLVDYISEQILAQKELEFRGLNRNHMSGNGNYFILENYGGYSWFSCTDNYITELKSIKEAESAALFSDFLAHEQTKVVVASSGHASVYDCKTQKLLHRWEFPAGLETIVFHVVKSSDELFICEGNELVLLNLETGERTVIGKTNPSYYMNKWSMVYNNGQVLWQEGKRLDVSNKL